MPNQFNALVKAGLRIARRQSQALSRYGSFDLVTTVGTPDLPARILAVVRNREKLTDDDIQKEVPKALAAAQVKLSAAATPAGQ